MLTTVFNSDVIYYTIIGMDELKCNLPHESNRRPETIKSEYVLFRMLNKLGINKTEINTSTLGKPFFNNNKIYFNYSHSNNYIACAISLENVGIDIEENTRVINKTMISICDLDASYPLAEFTKRESFCKLTGEGIAIFFDKNNFKDIDNYCKLITTEKYTCSICSKIANPIYKYIDIK